MSKYTTSTIYLHDPAPNMSPTEKAKLHDNIKKWISVQESVSPSMVALIDHAILRFGFVDVTYYKVQAELNQSSPFLDVFHKTYANHLDFKGDAIEAKVSKLYRASLLGKKLTKQDEEKYIRWFEAQVNQSASIRSLIIESVMISGFVNVMSPTIHQGLTLLHTFTKTFRLTNPPIEQFRSFVEASFRSLAGNEYIPFDVVQNTTYKAEPYKGEPDFLADLPNGNSDSVKVQEEEIKTAANESIKEKEKPVHQPIVSTPDSSKQNETEESNTKQEDIDVDVDGFF